VLHVRAIILREFRRLPKNLVVVFDEYQVRVCALLFIPPLFFLIWLFFH
jgi:hypothetical protein